MMHEHENHRLATSASPSTQTTRLVGPQSIRTTRSPSMRQEDMKGLRMARRQRSGSAPRERRLFVGRDVLQSHHRRARPPGEHRPRVLGSREHAAGSPDQALGGPVPIEPPQRVDRAARETSMPVSSSSTRNPPLSSTARARVIAGFAVLNIGGGLTTFFLRSKTSAFNGTSAEATAAKAAAEDSEQVSALTGARASASRTAKGRRINKSIDISPQPSVAFCPSNEHRKPTFVG